MLVFLTGEREIKEFCITLEQSLKKKQREIQSKSSHSSNEYTAKDFLLEDSDDEKNNDIDEEDKDDLQRQLDK